MKQIIDNKNAFQVSNLTVHYKNKIILENINFSFESGQMIGIVGPNGAGKSTLIKALLGIMPITHGSIYYNQKPLQENQYKIAYIPQKSQIDWDYPVTVWDVVMMGRIQKTGWFRQFSQSSYKLVTNALDKLGILDLKKCCIGELSGGQQQRVFLARALAQEAEILCLDEPLAGVDYTTQNIMFGILKQICKENKTVFVIHHDLGDLIKHFDQLVLLNKTIINTGTCKEVLNQKLLNYAYGD
uniref:manganese transport system ATP-binding protein n=1 Tax=Pseudoerythrocladia kornmannii TaxID=753682 RepID=UPI001BEE9FA8|nr:manganese transport system ATP-binding protein [Pseudoerythrocladia kornmannii]QUE28202.1 MntA [Pseudoerythrocladia kornmannii]UNJ16707.1 manganese transport system ATP-binding protein [Pseudoerythrocladia kornmannii]